MLYYNGLGLEVGTWHGCQQGHTTKMPPNPKYQDLCPIPKSHEEENQLLKVISWPPHEHLWHAHGCSHSHMHTHTLVRFNTLIYFVHVYIVCERYVCAEVKGQIQGTVCTSTLFLRQGLFVSHCYTLSHAGQTLRFMVGHPGVLGLQTYTTLSGFLYGLWTTELGASGFHDRHFTH